MRGVDVTIKSRISSQTLTSAALAWRYAFEFIRATGENVFDSHYEWSERDRNTATDGKGG